MNQVMLCESCEDCDACLDRFLARLKECEMVMNHEGRLATTPGSVHIHFRPLSERVGVLEYTMDVQGRRAWLSWHGNRYQPWIEDAIEKLKTAGCLKDG